MSGREIDVHLGAPIGVISPRLYGHFAEHLGRCCYDGIWVAGSDVPNDGGFRLDALDAMRKLPVPVLRWPGGCYADHYHWRGGIGPAASRPRRIGMSCDLTAEDDNSLGTHEFLRLCALLGAEPYLAGNMASGSPQELCDWVEYCNSSLDTTLTRERAANGAPEPWGVPLWGVGNESWGCGGNYDPTAYGLEYRRYATMLRHVDPKAELVVVGSEDAHDGRRRHWNARLLEALDGHFHLVDHLSVHTYFLNGGPELEFSEDDYYALFEEVEVHEAYLERTAALIARATGGKRRIGITVDEWGVWHPEVRSFGPGATSIRCPVTYEQEHTLREALATALFFEGLHRQCNVVSMANLAQIANILQAPIRTDGPDMWLTPTYHALAMNARHQGGTALAVDVSGGLTLPRGLSSFSATASRKGTATAVTLVNRHLEESAAVTVHAEAATERAEGLLLAADSPRAVNSPSDPDRVSPRRLEVSAGPDGWRVELPPHSMATLWSGARA